MIDGSEKRNRQLAFELQNLHVCEKRSKKKKNNCFVRSASFLYKKINFKHGWLLHRKPVLRSRKPEITGGLQYNRLNC